MARKKVSTKKRKTEGRLTVTIPEATYQAMKRLVDADHSLASIGRALMEEVFGVGKPAPKTLKFLAPEPGEKWPVITIYCSDDLRKRIMTEAQRQRGETTQARRGRPSGGAATAMAWLLTERYGETAW